MYHLCTHSMPVDLIGTSLKITYELSTMLLRKKTHVYSIMARMPLRVSSNVNKFMHYIKLFRIASQDK